MDIAKAMPDLDPRLRGGDGREVIRAASITVPRKTSPKITEQAGSRSTISMSRREKLALSAMLCRVISKPDITDQKTDAKPD